MNVKNLEASLNTIGKVIGIPANTREPYSLFLDEFNGFYKICYINADGGEVDLFSHSRWSLKELACFLSMVVSSRRLTLAIRDELLDDVEKSRAAYVIGLGRKYGLVNDEGVLMYLLKPHLSVDELAKIEYYKAIKSQFKGV